MLFKTLFILKLIAMKKCLNPYSNGICSLSAVSGVTKIQTCTVLILILMEYAL